MGEKDTVYSNIILLLIIVLLGMPVPITSMIGILVCFTAIIGILVMTRILSCTQDVWKSCLQCKHTWQLTTVKECVVHTNYWKDFQHCKHCIVSVVCLNLYCWLFTNIINQEFTFFVVYCSQWSLLCSLH